MTDRDPQTGTGRAAASGEGPGAAEGPDPRSAVVTVGDELLLGETTDTNAAWLGRELARRGIPVARRWTVADDEDDIRGAVAAALEVAELVLVTGGLGPTPDDLTRDAVAGLLDLPLEEDAAVLERIRTRFRDRGMEELPGPNRRVAQVPRGARTLDNPHGTAPGLALDAGSGRHLVLLPGVPRELEGIVEGSLDGLLEEWFGERLRPVHLRILHTTGIPESLLSEQVDEVLPGDTGPVRLAFLPDRRGVDIRLTAEAVDGDEARAWFDRVEEALSTVVDPWRFRAVGGDVVEAVSEALLEAGKTVATAESCTGGLVAQRLTARSGASDLFPGGVVAYADEAKSELLAVPAEILEGHGAVSEAVARAMAEGVAERFGTDAGLGVTGVAGPTGGTEAKPVGTVWYAVALDGRTVARRERFPGDREEVRDRSAQAVLTLLLRMLEGRVEPEDGSGA